jgi:hypothetical protein
MAGFRLCPWFLPPAGPNYTATESKTRKGIEMSRPHKETMFEDFDLAVIDVIAVERQARALRAKAMHDGLRAAARWIAARVGKRSAGAASPAGSAHA